MMEQRSFVSQSHRVVMLPADPAGKSFIFRWTAYDPAASRRYYETQMPLEEAADVFEFLSRSKSWREES